MGRRLGPVPRVASGDVRSPSMLAGMAVAAAVVAALAAAGCGSSSSKSTTKPPPAISKPAFVAKANRICTKGNKQLTAAQNKAFGKKRPTTAQFASFAKTSYRRIIQGQIDAVRALGAPPADKAKVAKMIALAENDLNDVESHPVVLGMRTDPFANFKKLAHPYGLTACASR